MKTTTANKSKTKKRVFTILFVCSGNTCRSPMAKALMDKIIKEDKKSPKLIKTLSCGTDAINGNLPSDEAVKTMHKYHIDLTKHRSLTLNKKLIKKADLVLTMEARHKDIVLSFDPTANDKTYLITEYIEQDKNGISDPLGKGLPAYHKTAQKLKHILEKVYQKLFKQYDL